MSKIFPQAIVFDFDGVIALSEPLHHRALRYTLKPLGVDVTEEMYFGKVLGLSDRDAILRCVEMASKKLTEAELLELIEKKSVYFQNHLNEMEPCPGSLEIIEQAYRLCPIAIASGAILDDIEFFLKNFGGEPLRKKFQTIVSADQVTHCKPHPEPYLTACQRMGVDPAHCLSFEDTPTGIRAGRAAGLKVIGVANTCAIDLIRPVANHVIPSFVGTTLETLLKEVSSV